MKYIYLVVALICFVVFAYEMENNRSFSTWIDLFLSGVFFAFSIISSIEDIIDRHLNK